MNLRTKRQLGVLALTLLLASATSACGGDDAPASADGPTKVTLSIPPVGDSLPVYDAIAKGYFAAEGLEVELRPAANGATTINALVSGSTDLALVSYPSLITARSGGIPVTIAAPAIAGTEEYASGLYVLADSDVKKPADMVGKKMATPSLGSVGDVWFRGELLQEGLDPSSVTYVEIPQANMAAALKAGDVDGIFQTEPTLSATQASLDIRLVGYQEGPQGLFATSATFLKDQPAAVAAFRAALAKAVADIEADPHGVATAMMPKYTKMSAEVAAKMRLPQYQVDYDAAGVQSVINLMVKVGLIKASFNAGDLYQDVK
ncbi:PhnD/SsuA/transferrin family substrate-binding protein [Nonomuraea sp. PA05]|uniref:ABC transporter substrate-binding protein n=1 Tax=Nonomuraea sp. PA05 TaxID=2604466 RepID=UPI0011D7D50E|nr:ABC transporter substrate-binding protein [Nonomuraea sp. PA05]TYB45212.1 PhnD/SsuA/transferrin family substrate-binding protein [Nonomuraea sp. PA05]